MTLKHYVLFIHFSNNREWLVLRDVSWHSYLKFRIRRINIAYNFPSYAKWLCKQRGLESRLRQTVNENFKSTICQLGTSLYGEKLSWVEVSPAYPSYPGRVFSYISLQNVANRLHVIGNELKLACSARRVTRLAGPPVWIGLVTLPAAPTFLHKLRRVNISDKEEKP